MDLFFFKIKSTISARRSVLVVKRDKYFAFFFDYLFFQNLLVITNNNFCSHIYFDLFYFGWFEIRRLFLFYVSALLSHDAHTKRLYCNGEPNSRVAFVVYRRSVVRSVVRFSFFYSSLFFRSAYLLWLLFALYVY